MLDVSPVIATLIMFGMLILLLTMGLPVAFALGGVGVMAILLLWGPNVLSLTVTSAWDMMSYYTLIAIPMFIFMAMLLKRSGIAEDLFKSMRLWAGRVPGGLAIGVVFICTIIAAMSGITGTGVVTMGILALPLMLKLGYNKVIAIGPIMAGGALGFLIPPSVSFIVYGAICQLSIGRLFLGGLIPGFILAAMYILFIAIRCYFKPELGPPLPPEERVGLKEKILSLKSVFLPGVLVMAVLGTLFLGVCSPTEAAGAGVIGAIVCAGIHRRLTWSLIMESSWETLRITNMIMWILIGAVCFKAVFFGVGGPAFVRGIIAGLDVPPLYIIFGMQLTYMVLGCFIDDLSILLISIPIYVPIVINLGFDPVWFGVLFIVNMQMATLTPPFGAALFYMRGVAPPEVTMADIYRSVTPFVVLQLIGVLLVLFFPQLVLWLPELVFGVH